ncbi:MAG: PQQ-dependent sugar dehydrogenase [Phycisphaerales bacterium]|nr:PQQ-dependent sugar dehydrogenase [Phycisphaerales bacterium]
MKSWNRYAAGLLIGIWSCFAALGGEVTPVGKVAAAKGWQLRTVIEDLDRPWGMAWLPDGSMLITEKAGRLRLVKDGTLQSDAVPGVPPVFDGGQGGLMDVAIHPKFAENRLVYFTYSIGGNGGNKTVLARAKFDGAKLEDWRVIFENSREKRGGQHFGSRMIWLPDGTLLLSVGDGGNPPSSLDGQNIRNQAQSTKTHFGKVLRLTDEGKAPTDNPFAKDEGAAPEVWSMGHRNIQGLVRDPVTGRVWATEHGALGGDELNIIRGGKNYGWPLVTYSREYSGAEITKERSRPGMEDPVAVWTPCIAASGLAVYNGERFPQWKGNLFAGGLVSQDVRRIRVDADGKALEQDAIRIGARVRDVRQGPDGFLYVLTDERPGKLIRIEPSTPD